jgi:GT2 family glycosyltransferase
MNQNVYILLPVHNRLASTQKFVSCLKAQTYSHFHLVLIDDGSTDGTENMVRTSLDPEKLSVIKGKGNWWWGGSLQQGINRLQRLRPDPLDIVLIINDDVTFHADFVERGVRELRKTDKTLLLARNFDEATGKIEETGIHADFRYFRFDKAGPSQPVNCLSTRGLFMRWDTLERIGGFYPVLLPHYGSDYEFTMRAMRKDFRLKTDAHVYLVPDVSSTGFRKIPDGANWKDVVRMLFTRKSVMNPIYATSFVLLASPVKWIPINVLKIWLRAGKQMIRSIRGQ